MGEPLKRTFSRYLEMKRTLRILIVLNWVTAIAAGTVAGITSKYLPMELIAFQENQRQVTQLQWVVFVIEGFLLLLSVINSIGLFLFRRWARSMLVPLYVLALLLLPSNAVYIQTGWTKMLFNLSYLVSGMIIAIVFFSPLAEAFNRGSAIEQALRER